MSGPKVLIVDYGVGNHQSVFNALTTLGYKVESTGDLEKIKSADVYILPGVGAFAEAMKNIKKRKIDQVLGYEVLEKKKPILGICLGMQILSTQSTELGLHKGLNWIDGQVEKLELEGSYRVPHVGWNTVNIYNRAILFTKAHENTSYYFDHSYHFVCDDRYVMARCVYGREFVAAVRKDNIFGVQFHPEKSQTSGLKLFRSFFNYLDEHTRTGISAL